MGVKRTDSVLNLFQILKTTIDGGAMRLGFLFLFFIFLQNLHSQTDTSIVLLPSKMSIVEKSLWGEKGFFRITGIAPLTPKARENELKIRRAMLTMHQLGGLTTLGLMALSGYYGKKVYDGKFEFVDEHRTLVRVTIASYTLTALLAITSPPPLIRREKSNGSIAIHKTLAWVHSTGMIVTAILGRNTTRYSIDYNSYNRSKKIHMGSAIVTFISLAASMVIIMLR
jgi:hypothetical protein